MIKLKGPHFLTALLMGVLFPVKSLTTIYLTMTRSCVLALTVKSPARTATL